ncbi:MAG: PEGA domain-containing protein [Calditrichaeota bacterium]|nr:MAG: PEGA domain-containing protein [Calditrichota bacterium]
MSVTKVIDEKYEIHREIKRGGFGLIYEGVDLTFGKPIAIKAVDPNLLGEAKYIDMFQAEALNIAQFSHHNIVHIFDIKRDPTGQFYIIMEFIDGPDLGTMIKECLTKKVKLPLHLGLYIIAEACAGLDYAHNRRDSQTNEPLNIVHQDISPSNIMITRTGEVKLIDFGLANLRRKQPKNKKEVVIQGKLNYIVPEMVKNSNQLDRRSDIFALGLVLYEILTGERVIKQKSPEAVINHLIAGKLDLSGITDGSIPDKVAEAIQKALAIDPDNRYPTANHFYMDLMHQLIVYAPTADFMTELSDFINEIVPLKPQPDVNGVPSEDTISTINGFKSGNEFDATDFYEVGIETDEDGQGALYEKKPEPEPVNNGISADEIPDSEISESTEIELLNDDLVDLTESAAIVENESPANPDFPENSDAKVASDATDKGELSEAEIISADLDSDETALIETAEVESIDLQDETSKESLSVDSESPSDTPDDDPDSNDEGSTDSVPADEVRLGQIKDEDFSSDSSLTIDITDKLANEISSEEEIFTIDEQAADTFQESKSEETVEVVSGSIIENREVSHSSSSPEKPFEIKELSDDEELKTIIDIVRLSTRNHKKSIIFSLIAIFVLAVCYSVFDVMTQRTAMGVKIYDLISPPAAKINSYPSGAQVYLDDVLQADTTPLRLEKIKPGIHKLKLVLPRFEPIIRSINVPSKGVLKIAGENEKDPTDPFVFNFSSKLNISSTPPGATIQVNDVLMSSLTPTQINWEITEEPIEIKLTIAGYPDLTGFMINSEDGSEIIPDRRFWKFSRNDPVKDDFEIGGIFRKFITIKSVPSRAQIVINNSPVGTTGINGEVALTPGKHEIILRKKGYIDRRKTLTVSEKTPEQITEALLRKVRVFVKNSTRTDDSDIGASIVSLRGSGRTTRLNKRTPAEITLLPYTYAAMLKKQGFHDKEITIGRNQTNIVVRMDPIPAEVEIYIVDSLTNMEVEDVAISYKLLQTKEPEKSLGTANEKGEMFFELPPGMYQFTINKAGYQPVTKNLRVKTGRRNRLTFRFVIQN